MTSTPRSSSASITGLTFMQLGRGPATQMACTGPVSQRLDARSRELGWVGAGPGRGRFCRRVHAGGVVRHAGEHRHRVAVGGPGPRVSAESRACGVRVSGGK